MQNKTRVLSTLLLSMAVLAVTPAIVSKTKEGNDTNYESCGSNNGYCTEESCTCKDCKCTDCRCVDCPGK